LVFLVCCFFYFFFFVGFFVMRLVAIWISFSFLLGYVFFISPMSFCFSYPLGWVLVIPHPQVFLLLFCWPLAVSFFWARPPPGLLGMEVFDRSPLLFPLFFGGFLFWAVFDLIFPTVTLLVGLFFFFPPVLLKTPCSLRAGSPEPVAIRFFFF